MAIKSTLQTRLIVLMVIASVILIAAFTTIQLNNQAQRVLELNVYRAKQSAFIVRDELERVFSDTGQVKNRIARALEIKRLFHSSLDTGGVETAILLNRQGSPEILEGNLKLVFEDRETFLREIKTAEKESRWLVPIINKKHKLASLFITFDNPYGYVVKLTFSLGNLQQVLNEVYVPVLLMAIIVIAANVMLAGSLSRALVLPVQVLNEATKKIADGDLDMKVALNTKDELEELARTFNYMTSELKKMREKAEDANPLTKLPGNIVIQREVEKRIREGVKFVLIYADLDNFKAFNDKYGVHTGDRAIMLTADIAKETISKIGVADDFVGHEGGDDFLLLTAPERASKIAEFIITEFDKRIRELYSKDDLERGYIETTGRDETDIRRYPIMTISLAGVGNFLKNIKTYTELTYYAAEIKKALKKNKNSSFLMDRRTGHRG